MIVYRIHRGKLQQAEVLEDKGRWLLLKTENGEKMKSRSVLWSSSELEAKEKVK